MDLLEFVSMHFKMLHMKSYLEHYHEKCESPAELLFYDALIRKTGIKPIVQMKWDCTNGKQYRLDFAYHSKILPVLFNLEVDGVVFHKHRILKDKARDEDLLKDNVVTIRTTGKFIYKDPDTAATEAIKKIIDYHKQYKESEKNKLA